MIIFSSFMPDYLFILLSVNISPLFILILVYSS